jgi:hypothetical protein
MRPSTLAEAVERMQSQTADETALAEFVDAFLMASDDDARYAAIECEPARTGEPRIDALAGAVAEYLAKQCRLGRVPAWAAQPWRRLDEPWFTTSSPSAAMREYLSIASPAEFRSRNIFTDEQPLRRARSHLPFVQKLRASSAVP